MKLKGFGGQDLWQKIQAKVSPKVLFISIMMVLLCLTGLVVLNLWSDWRLKTDDPNYFHETAALILIFIAGIYAYFRLLVKRVPKAIKQAEQREARKAKEVQLFTENMKRLTTGKEISVQLEAIKILGKIAVKNPLKRQEVLDILEKANHWMLQNRDFLLSQNLIAWRIKKDYYPQIETSKQRLSIACIAQIEKIIRAHIGDFKKGKTDLRLHLKGKCIPTLNLSGLTIKSGCIDFESARLYQIDFSQGYLHDISFKATALQKANFTGSDLEVDFKDSLLNKAHFHTDLRRVENLTAKQFFTLHEWENNLLTTKQVDLFFPNKDHESTNWKQWKDGDLARGSLLQRIEKSDKL